jgi:hypothetical protein
MFGLMLSQGGLLYLENLKISITVTWMNNVIFADC